MSNIAANIEYLIFAPIIFMTQIIKNGVEAKKPSGLNKNKYVNKTTAVIAGAFICSKVIVLEVSSLALRDSESDDCLSELALFLFISAEMINITERDNRITAYNMGMEPGPQPSLSE